MKKYFITFIACLLILTPCLVFSANKTFTGPGNFSDNTKWNASALPVAGDNLQINGTCTFDNAANNLVYGTLNIGFGAAGTLNWPVGGTNTLNVTTVSSTTAGSALNMTNGGTLKMSGTWTTTNQTFTAGTGTIDYTGAGAQTIVGTTYYNLIHSGTGTGTLGNNTTVNNNLTVSAGTFAPTTRNLTVTGTTSVTGATYSDASNTGVNTFVGQVTVGASGVWTTTTSTATARYVFRGGISSTGTSFSAGGATFNTNAQTISGSTTLSFANIVTLTGIALTNNGTVSITGTGAGRLAGTGTWTQGVNSTLNYAGSTLTVTTVNFNTNTPNTVNYNSAIAQTIRGTTYYNLTKSAAGTGTLGAATIVNNNLVVSGGVFAPTTFNLTVTGTTSVSAATYSDASNTGVNTFVGLVTIGATGVWNTTASTTAGGYIFRGGISNSGTSFSGGEATFNTNAQTVSGSTTISFANVVTVTGIAVTNTGTVSMTATGAGTLAGTGTWTQGVNGTLNYSGSTITVTTVNFNTNTPNTVDYNSALAQTIRTATYYNLTISAAGTSTLAGAIAINNNLSITGGTLDCSTFQITGNATGTCTMSAGTFLTLGLTTSATSVLFPTLYTAAKITLNATSTVTYSTNGAQTISATPTYGNLTLTSGVLAATKTLSASPLAVAGNLTITNGTLTVALSATTSTINLTGNLAGTGTLSFTTGTLNISGNNTQTGTFTFGTSTVNYNGSGAQTVRGTTYYNLTHSGSGTGTLGAAAVVGNNLAITGGTLACSTFLITGNATGTFTMSASTNLTLGLTTSVTVVSLPTLFVAGNTTLNATSTVTYQTNAAQIISSTPTYGNLTLTTGAAAAIKTVSASPIAIAGNLTLTNGAGIVTLSATTSTINLTGNLSGTGTLTFSTGTLNIAGNNTQTGTFTSGTGLVNYNGSGAQTVRNTSYYNLTFSNAGTKQLAAGTTNVARDISITGTAAGDFTTNSSVINFNGTSTVTSVSATNFYDITVATASSAALSSAENLINSLNLTGTGTFNTNNNLTLISTSSKTASIGTLGTPANFTGNITMQRYVSGTQGYRYTGSAISGATLSNLTPELRFDGFTGTTEPTYWCNVYTYNESVAGAFATGWTKAVNVTDAMTAGKGFAIYYYAMNLTPTVTLDITGPINKGNQTLPITFNSSSNADDGWNLVSNPYPSAIDWDAASGWTRTNIVGNTYYAWNNINQNYASYPAGGPVGTNGGTRYIASSQAFMVKTTAGPALNMTESVKTSTNPSPAFWKVAANDMSAFTLKITSNANTYSDETMIRFATGATAAKDADYDAYKLPSTNTTSPNIATLTSDTAAVCVNTYSDLTTNVHIPITVQGIAATYTIELNQENNFPKNSCLILEDIFTNIFTDLKITPSYSYTATATSTPVKRFILHVAPPIFTVTSSNPVCNGGQSGEIIVNAANGTSSYTLKDISDNVIKSISNVSVVDTIKNIAAGKYILYSSDVSSYCQTTADTITITEPAPFSVSKFLTNVSCLGYNDGNANIQVSGNNGSYVYTWSNGSTNDTITNLIFGKYYLTISDYFNCSIKDSVTIGNGAAPATAAFTSNVDTVYMTQSTIVNFTNTSLGVDSVKWNFGDGVYAAIDTVAHAYADTGSFVVVLVVYSNGGCFDSANKIIKVLPDVLSSVTAQSDENPNITVQVKSGSILASMKNIPGGTVQLNIVNVLGQSIYKTDKQLQGNSAEISIHDQFFPDGVYYINVICKELTLTKKIFISNK